MLIECPDCDAELAATACGRGRREPTDADLEAVRAATLALHRQLVHAGLPELTEEEERRA